MKNLSIYGSLFVIAVGIAGAAGWIWNIVKLIAMLDGGITAMFVARAVGVFAAPLGAILGYL